MSVFLSREYHLLCDTLRSPQGLSNYEGRVRTTPAPSTSPSSNGSSSKKKKEKKKSTPKSIPKSTPQVSGTESSLARLATMYRSCELRSSLL